jgi:hypothetical protein
MARDLDWELLALAVVVEWIAVLRTGESPSGTRLHAGAVERWAYRTGRTLYRMARARGLLTEA